jgi:leader peptidase (prepilin peptidase)/N-methyltransferase
MNPLIIFLIFVLGTIVGSFINVIVLRYNTGLSAFSGRSVCFHCGKKLQWYELLPVVSFFLQGGKCRDCNVRLSLQYPMVEILTGIIFVGVALREWSLWPVYGVFDHGFLYLTLLFVYYAFVFSLLLAIAVYDSRHKIIPDSFAWMFIILSVSKLILFFVVTGFNMTPENWFNALSPILLFLPISAMWYFSGGRWIGFGDAKLCLGIGALIGFISGVSAVILAFWIGAVWSILFLFVERKKYKTAQQEKAPQEEKTSFWQKEVPFAPFLVAATIITFFFNFDFLSLGGLLNLF